MRSNGPLRRLELGGALGQCGGRCLRVPIGPVGCDQHRLVGPDRDRVSQLLLGFGGAQGHHDDGSAVRLLDPNCLFDGALLVRTHREWKMTGIDRLLVVGEDDAGAGGRHPFHTDENSQLFIRWSSGSKSGVDPATATFTG